MSAHAQTSVAAHYEDAPSARDVQVELEETKLGIELLELLRKAEDIHIASERAWERAALNGRRSSYRQSSEARLAEQLLNLLGGADDCFFIREIAERIAQ